MSEDQSNLSPRWTKVKLEHSERLPAWVAHGDGKAIGLIVETEPSIHVIECRGPNGLGTGATKCGFGLAEAVMEAELTLRELGWRMTPEGFEHGDGQTEKA